MQENLTSDRGLATNRPIISPVNEIGTEWSYFITFRSNSFKLYWEAIIFWKERGIINQLDNKWAR